jgi:hypothetical protein
MAPRDLTGGCPLKGLMDNLRMQELVNAVHFKRTAARAFSHRVPPMRKYGRDDLDSKPATPLKPHSGCANQTVATSPRFWRETGGGPGV